MTAPSPSMGVYRARETVQTGIGQSITLLAKDCEALEELAALLGPMLGPETRLLLTSLLRSSAPEVVKVLG